MQMVITICSDFGAQENKMSLSTFSPIFLPWSDIEVGSLNTYFMESFYHKLILNFVKSFFCIYWDDHMIFFLIFLK